MVYLFKPVLISFVNMIGFFPRSIFNKYTVINFKWCLGRRLMSILPQMAKSQRRVNSVASKVQTWLSVFLGFSPGFLSWSWQHFPSLTLCISVQREVARQFTGAGFLGCRSYIACDVTMSEGEILPLRPALKEYSIQRIY